MPEANEVKAVDHPDADRYTFYEGGPSQICHTDHGYKTLSIDFAGSVFDAKIVEQAIADSEERWVNLHICRVSGYRLPDSQEIEKQ